MSRKKGVKGKGGSNTPHSSPNPEKEKGKRAQNGAVHPSRPSLSHSGEFYDIAFKSCKGGLPQHLSVQELLSSSKASPAAHLLHESKTKACSSLSRGTIGERPDHEHVTVSSSGDAGRRLGRGEDLSAGSIQRWSFSGWKLHLHRRHRLQSECRKPITLGATEKQTRETQKLQGPQTSSSTWDCWSSSMLRWS
ncbi:hypothetical protein DNTS_025256 [Danionella cerebrum]|uniref:Uncharacterized protein n=1 Tax=Danionella cerebrum TaxID=2873325 RepID=A0A553Q1F9_9TELE|nr:hypothetical protein DNTS_025256 [Danionella translucida]